MDGYFIGLMSGTSVDGIDAVLLKTSQRQIHLSEKLHLEFDSSTRSTIETLCQNSRSEISTAATVDAQLGKLYAEAVNALILKSGIRKDDVVAIGSHGQTIAHFPEAENPYTLQIGDPNKIAFLTGITTVADFRRKDTAAGGEGATLVPLFHQQIFNTDNRYKVAVNIGGISNITYLPRSDSEDVIGFDTGPGNRLLDLWCQLSTGSPFDDNGSFAKSGTINKLLLDRMLAEPYFTKAYPKSTGRELFNQAWLDSHLSDQPSISQPDIQATLTELTAISITKGIDQLPEACGEIIICGGGAFNSYLIERIAVHNPASTVVTSDKYGIEPQWVEASAFAWLAKQTLEGKPGNIASVTGASGNVILGGIYPGQNWPGIIKAD